MRYLFERIVAPTQPNSVELLKEDVRAQVQRLLDSHRIAQYRGGLDILNMSMPSVTEAGSNSLKDKTSYANKILQLIKRFEPRLENPQVSLVPAGDGSMSVNVQIQAVLKTAEHMDAFHFVSTLDSD